MPTDLFSVIIYVFLLVPGIVYTRQIERYQPQGKLSAFAETATVIVASSAALLMTWIVAVLLTGIPPIRPWITSLISDPETVRSERPLPYIGFIALALGLAVVFGYVGGHPKLRKFLNITGSREGEIKQNTSAWAVAFDADLPGPVIVTAQLKNGDWIQGPLHHWNPSPDETQDRSFVLYGPIWFRSSDAESEELLNQPQMFVVSAAEVVYLTVAKDPHRVFVRTAEAEQNEIELKRANKGGPRMLVHRVSTLISNATKPSDSTN